MRLDGDGAEIELLCHHHAARLGPRRHLLDDRDGVAHMHEEETAEGEIEGRAVRRLEGEQVCRDLLELRAALATQILQRFRTKCCVDLDAGDPALRPDAVGHQPHHRARPRADIEAAHAGPEPDGRQHSGRGALPHAGLIAQTLIFSGVARMHVTVGVGFAGRCHGHLGPC